VKIPFIELGEPIGFPKPFDPAEARREKEVLEAELEAVAWMEHGLRALHAEAFLPPGFLIDLSQPPYTVPCPTCGAFALDACRHEPRGEPRQTIFGPVPGPWPATSRMLKDAHPARHRHWAEHPEFRVVPLR
jgi:hypothetical protein